MAPQWNHRRRDAFFLRLLVEEVAGTLGSQLASRAIAIVLNVPPEQTIVADRRLLRRAIEDLMLNAVAAMPSGGELVLTSAAGRGVVELEIADSGAPLSDDARRHAFDPLPVVSRGRDGGELAMVRQIAELHDGTVTAANCPDGGVAFTLQIPQPTRLEAAA
jgi:two-component system sensor histidine kinase HydH